MLLSWTVCFRFGCLGLLYCTFALTILDFRASVKWNYFRWHFMSTPTCQCGASLLPAGGSQLCFHAEIAD